MHKSIAVVGMVLGIGFALPAQALNQRTWVSGKGIDQGGCGAIANPCRTLQFAHDATNAGGEIDVLDPAGYGTVAISKSISIVNDSAGIAGLFSTQGTQAVSIESEQRISVLLRGLTIDGAGANSAAITFLANGSLSIQNCLVKNSSGFFAFADAPSSIQVLNSTFSNNTGQAITVMQSGNSQNENPLKVVIDKSVVTGTGLHGIYLSKLGSSRLSFTISESTVSSNGNGIWVGDGVDGVVRNSTITQNQTGISGFSLGPLVSLTGNTIYGNYMTGVDSTAGIKTFGDNKITGNGTDVSGYLTPVSPQ